MAKPALGYPSRTDAVMALLASGVTLDAIAERLGISPNTVSALAAARRLKDRSSPPEKRAPVPQCSLYVPVPIHTAQQLRRDARERDVSVERLIADLVDVIARDGLVTAVLGEIGDER